MSECGVRVSRPTVWEGGAASQRHHRGAVRERSQGLSLRNPWIDSIDQLHPGGMREKTQMSPEKFLASLRDALSPTTQPGVSKTQPLATIVYASGVKLDPKGNAVHRFGIRSDAQYLSYLYSFNARTNRAEFLFNRFIAAIDVIDALDSRFIFCHQGSENQRCGCSKV